MIERVSERTGLLPALVEECIYDVGEAFAEELLEKGYTGISGWFSVTLVWRRNWRGFWEHLPGGRQWCPFLYPYFVLHVRGYKKRLRKLTETWRQAYRLGWPVGEPASHGHIILYRERHAKRRKGKSAG